MCCFRNLISLRSCSLKKNRSRSVLNQRTYPIRSCPKTDRSPNQSLPLQYPPRRFATHLSAFLSRCRPRGPQIRRSSGSFRCPSSLMKSLTRSGQMNCQPSSRKSQTTYSLKMFRMKSGSRRTDFPTIPMMTRMTQMSIRMYSPTIPLTNRTMYFPTPCRLHRPLTRAPSGTTRGSPYCR